MQSTDLDLLTIVQDRKLTVRPRLWAYACMLGDARVRSNSRSTVNGCFSSSTRSHIDMMGAFAEIFLYHCFLTMGASKDLLSRFRHHVFSPDGGSAASDVDLEVDDVRIDVKSFDCSPRKKFFAINKRKHESLRGKCHNYLCVMAAPYGGHAVISNLIWYPLVSTWRERDLNKSGRTALVMPIGKFCETYAPNQFGKVSAMSKKRYEELRIHQMLESDVLRNQLVGHFKGLEGWI